ncbi:hypothetical protein ACU4GD_21515 [Cupriavidus basilensis]
MVLCCDRPLRDLAHRAHPRRDARQRRCGWSLIAELSGRLTEFGLLAAIEAVGGQSGPAGTPRQCPQPCRPGAQRRRLTGLEPRRRRGRRRLEPDAIHGARPAAGPAAGGHAMLDRQVAQIQREPDPARRAGAIRGALNAFGAVTGFGPSPSWSRPSAGRSRPPRPRSARWPPGCAASRWRRPC